MIKVTDTEMINGKMKAIDEILDGLDFVTCLGMLEMIKIELIKEMREETS